MPEEKIVSVSFGETRVTKRQLAFQEGHLKQLPVEVELAERAKVQQAREERAAADAREAEVCIQAFVDEELDQWISEITPV